MTTLLKNTWANINKVLTFINAFLFALLTGNTTNPKDIKNSRIPVVANICLLVFLGLGVVAAIYAL